MLMNLSMKSILRLIQKYFNRIYHVSNQQPNILQVLEKLDGITINEDTQEKVHEKSITEKKIKTNNSNGITTHKKSSANRRSVLSNIISNLSSTISQLHVSK